jgi:hypothetical protein
MLQDWEQVNATWEDPQGHAGNTITNGVTPEGTEASAQADAVVAEPGRAGRVQIPLNADTIQSWANGSLDNFGWSIVSNSPSLWSFNSSEAFQIGTFKPELTILYTAPADTDKGAFGFSVDNYTANESGGTVTITVNRVGGKDGAATANWRRGWDDRDLPRRGLLRAGRLVARRCAHGSPRRASRPARGPFRSAR